MGSEPNKLDYASPEASWQPQGWVIVVLFLVVLFGCRKEESGPAVKEAPLTDQQKTEIATQVLRGERPESDLAKYGISIGESRGMSIEEFQKQLAKEQAATKPSK